MSQDTPYDLTPDEPYPSMGTPPPPASPGEGSGNAPNGASPATPANADAGTYDIAAPTSPPTPSEPQEPKLKPGDPGWVPPVVIVEKEVPAEPAAADEVPVDPDVQKFKGMAVLAYVCFLIPLIAAPNSRFARFHANQGLLCFLTLVMMVIAVTILNFGLWITGRIVTISLLSWFFSCGLTFLEFAAVVGWIALAISGIIHAANGEKKELPVVGQWTLIK